MILCAVFGPIPGNFFNVATSSVITAIANSVGSIFDKIFTADFAPIPPTLINNSNVINSSLVKKPNKLISSCETLVYVKILILEFISKFLILSAGINTL